MTEIFNDIIKAQIGRVKASVISDDYFPIIGNTIRLDATTKWGQTSEWQTNDGNSETTVAGNLTKQKDDTSVKIAAAGELHQKFIARNKIFSAEVLKTIYAMTPQTLPYFSVKAKEIARVGEDGNVWVQMENGYTRTCTIAVRVYKENETATYKVLEMAGRPTPEYQYSFAYSFSDKSERGIYDVEVDVTDGETGITFSQRHNKLITVTPKLCPKPTDTSQGYEVVSTYKAETSYSNKARIPFELRLWRDVNGSGLNYAEAVIPRGEADNAIYERIPVSSLPAGTTLCVKSDPKEEEKYPLRLLLIGNANPDITNENGTPNFTYEEPLVITHDTDGIMDWGWRAYGAINLNNNCRNIVFDGRGYNNTSVYFHVFDSSMFSDTCIFLVSGTSDFEIFCVDIDGAGFAGILAKTDPNPNMPHFWRENGWEFKNLRVHHSDFRNTFGEGVYLGYFYSKKLSSQNNEGVAVTYQAHIMRDIRIYHCNFIDNGFDSVQINNACGVEFCYNVLSGCGYRREPNQGSAFSCTMDGKVYNCVVKNNYSVIGVIGPHLDSLEIFNCILTAARYEPGFSITLWAHDNDSITEITDLTYNIHNNVIKAANIANLNGDVIFDNYTMNDNIFITERGEKNLPGYFKGSGNIFIEGDIDYENIDAALKVADSINYNYQPAHNAISVTAGKSSNPFDFRGYRNWFANVNYAGPFMGQYKDAGIADENVVLRGFTLAGGTPSTFSQKVTVQLTYYGDVIKYRIGETADLSSVDWVDIPADGIEYSLSDGYGAKTVYAQVASGNAESAVLSASINYQAAPLSLDSISATGGYNATATVVFNFSGDYTPAKYRLGETSDLASAEWMGYTDSIHYTFDSAGDKTLYGQLQDSDGNLSEIKSVDVTVYDGKAKMVISIGWSNGETNNKPSVFDSDNKLTRIQLVNSNTNKPIYYTDGVQAGTLTKIDTQGASYMVNDKKGCATGDDSGIYPDIILEHNVITGGSTADYAYRDIHISIPAGTYKVRLLCNTIFNRYAKGKFKYQLVSGGIEYPYEISDTYTFVNNVQEFIEQTIVVTDEGFNVQWGPVTTGGTYMIIPLNIIEIEGV